jgi:hypothetical protein
MDTIILIPGILGSKLNLNGNEIWPLTLPEIIFGYDHNRIAQILDPAATASGIIDQVACFPIYKQLDDDLDIIAKATGATKKVFFYDWRKDIRTHTARLLAAQIADCVKNGSKSITLVAHSMGGLVARLLLEGGYAKESWFSSIKVFVAICSPHHGAPQALSEALGLEGSSGIVPADMPILTSNPNYPAAYQNFPAPNYYRLREQPGNKRQDVYNDTVATHFHLDPANTAAAKSSFSALDLTKRPTHVHYSFIAGSHHPTLEQINVTGKAYSFSSDTSGDGTVPLWSAAPGPIVAFATPGDHVGIFQSYPFRSHLYEILTGSKLMAPHLSDEAVVSISIDRHVYAPNEAMSVLIIPDTPTHELNGTLLLSRTSDSKGGSAVRYGVGQAVNYHGPVISHFSSTLKAPSDVGGYRLTFQGSHVTTDVTAAGFVASNGGGRRFSRP